MVKRVKEVSFLASIMADWRKRIPMVGRMFWEKGALASNSPKLPSCQDFGEKNYGLHSLLTWEDGCALDPIRKCLAVSALQILLLLTLLYDSDGRLSKVGLVLPLVQPQSSTPFNSKETSFTNSLENYSY